MLGTCLENVRNTVPLVHNITNYVTVNDVANILLACGGSPIMSDEPEDVEDITSICGGLNINIGTLNKNTIPSMFLAGRKANELGHIVLLDPVGAGASRLRTDTANRLMREVRFDAVRGNISEIKTLCTGSGTTKGVDADAVDAVTEANLDDGVALVKAFARQAGCIIAVTGAIDLVSDGERCWCIRNGRPEMSRITGTGCQLSALTTAFLRQIRLLIPASCREKVRIAIAPDFLHEQTVLAARCIIFLHLGTIIVAAAMALTAWKEAASWNTPSAN